MKPLKLMVSDIHLLKNRKKKKMMMMMLKLMNLYLMKKMRLIMNLNQLINLNTV